MGVKTNIYLEGHHLVNIMDGLNVKRNSKKTPKYLKNIDFWLPVENDSHQVMTAYKQLLGATLPQNPSSLLRLIAGSWALISACWWLIGPS